jgi:hypothetical protein
VVEHVLQALSSIHSIKKKKKKKKKKTKKKNRKTNNNKTMKKNLIPSRIPRMGRESGVAVLWSLSLLP